MSCCWPAIASPGPSVIVLSCNIFTKRFINSLAMKEKVERRWNYQLDSQWTIVWDVMSEELKLWLETDTVSSSWYTEPPCAWVRSAASKCCMLDHKSALWWLGPSWPIHQLHLPEDVVSVGWGRRHRHGAPRGHDTGHSDNGVQHRWSPHHHGHWLLLPAITCKNLFRSPSRDCYATGSSQTPLTAAMITFNTSQYHDHFHTYPAKLLLLKFENKNNAARP